MKPRSIATVSQLLARTPSPDAPGDVLILPVLLLNRGYQPVRITTVRRAIQLLYTGTARVLDEDGALLDFDAWRDKPIRDGHDDAIPILAGALRVPRVLRLGEYARLRRPTVRLTRRNVMLRDGHRCQYCGSTKPAAQLNLDHVHPRSRGGQDSWENLVTACHPCNRRKAQRTPEEASMPLLSTPKPPRWSHVVQLLVGTTRAYDEWAPYLQAC